MIKEQDPISTHAALSTKNQQGPSPHPGRSTPRAGNGHDLLTPETETTLVHLWQKNGDRNAIDRLIGSHQRLVARIAREYRGYGLPHEDLISEGNVGLMQAVGRFDCSQGFRFSTYARWWVRAALTDYVMRNVSIVRMVISDADKKLFFGLRRLKARYMKDLNGELTPEATEAIAKHLSVSREDVERMDQRLSKKDLSTNAVVRSESESPTEWETLIADETVDIEGQFLDRDERKKRWSLVKNAMRTLDAREQRILSARLIRTTPATLGELGAEFGISRERVRQIEVNALKKLTWRVRKAARADQEIALGRRRTPTPHDITSG